MTIDESNKLASLVRAYGTASEALGSCTGSYGWNALYYKQNVAWEAVQAYAKSLIPTNE